MVGRESCPINMVFLWHQEMPGGLPGAASAPQPQQRKVRAIWRKGQCGETHFQDIFTRKDLLLQDAASQQALCLYIPVPDALLANTACEEQLAAPPGKAATRRAAFHAWLLHTSPAMLLRFTSPPTEESFYQQLCQEAESSAADCLALSLAKGAIFCSCACILSRSWKHTPYSAIQQALKRSSLVMVAHRLSGLLYLLLSPPMPHPQKKKKLLHISSQGDRLGLWSNQSFPLLSLPDLSKQLWSPSAP